MGESWVVSCGNGFSEIRAVRAIIDPSNIDVLCLCYNAVLSSSLLQKLENPFRDGRHDIFSACLNPPPDNFVTDASHIIQEQRTYILLAIFSFLM